MAASSSLFSDHNRTEWMRNWFYSITISYDINKFVMEKGKRLVSYSAIYLLKLKFVYYVHVRVF